MCKFLNFIRKNKCYYVEMIYDEINKSLLYASKYYITQKMNKICANEYNNIKRKRSYSEDETIILQTLSK